MERRLHPQAQNRHAAQNLREGELFDLSPINEAMPRTEKKKMIKDKIVDGAHNAPHRSLYRALGLTKEELDRPLIAVVSSYNEIVPGHMNLDKITEAVKLGIAMAGGTPIMFPAIAVCDGIAMGHVGMKYSLVTRDLIADSTEAMVMAHGFDGMVMIPNCDKNVPGLLMASARLNIPTVFVSGGPMLAGRVGGKKTSLQVCLRRSALTTQAI